MHGLGIPRVSQVDTLAVSTLAESAGPGIYRQGLWICIHGTNTFNNEGESALTLVGFQTYIDHDTLSRCSSAYRPCRPMCPHSSYGVRICDIGPHQMVSVQTRLRSFRKYIRPQETFTTFRSSYRQVSSMRTARLSSGFFSSVSECWDIPMEQRRRSQPACKTLYYGVLV